LLLWTSFHSCRRDTPQQALRGLRRAANYAASEKIGTAKKRFKAEVMFSGGTKQIYFRHDPRR
jgi:hypothetical protein